MKYKWTDMDGRTVQAIWINGRRWVNYYQCAPFKDYVTGGRIVFMVDDHVPDDVELDSPTPLMLDTMVRRNIHERMCRAMAV